MSHATVMAIDQKTLWGGGGSPFKISYGKMMMWFFLISDALTFGGLLSAMGFLRHRFVDSWPDSIEVFLHFPFCGETHVPLLYVGLMTFILILSSVTMVLAVEAGHRLNRKQAAKWMFLTVLGGFFFLFSQVWEWSHFIHGTEEGAIKLFDGRVANYANEEKTALLLHQKDENMHRITISGDEAAKLIATGTSIFGATLKGNEYGHTLYANFFFFVTGFHGFHVFSGVCINIIILIQILKGIFDKRGHYEMVEKAGLYWHFVDLVWVFVFTFYYLV